MTIAHARALHGGRERTHASAAVLVRAAWYGLAVSDSEGCMVVLLLLLVLLATGETRGAASTPTSTVYTGRAFSVKDDGTIVLSNDVRVVSSMGFYQSAEPRHCPADSPFRYGTASQGIFCCANKTRNSMDCDTVHCCLEPGTTQGCQHIPRCSSADEHAGGQWLNLGSSMTPSANHAWDIRVNRSQAPTRYFISAFPQAVSRNRSVVASWSMERQITSEGHRLVVRDTFRSTSSGVSGIRIVNSAQTLYPSAVVLPGTLRPFQCESSITAGTFGAPHIWMSVRNGSSAIGLTPLDDIFRTHAHTRNAAVGKSERQPGTWPACTVTDPPAIELHEPHFGLAPGRTMTLEWAIYPFFSEVSSVHSAQESQAVSVSPAPSTTDFLAFVNQMRRDFGTDTITMNGTGYLSLYGPPELAIMRQPPLRTFKYATDAWWNFSASQMADFINDQAMHFVVSTNGGFGAKDACVSAGGNTHLDVDGSRFLVDPPPGYVDFLRTIISQVEAAKAAQMLRGTVKPLQYIHTSISTGGDDQQRHIDARVLDSLGNQVFLENCHGVSVCNASVCDYPLFYATQTNSYYTVLRQYVDKALSLGFDGLYHDEFGATDVMFTYGGPWDNVSVIMNSETNAVVATPANLWLLTQGAEIDLFKYIVSRGGVLVANGAPPTQSWYKLRPASLHFAENSMAHRALSTQVYTPIMLSRPFFQTADDDPLYNTPSDTRLCTSVLQHLDFGVLTFGYDGLFPNSSATNRYQSIFEKSFPITVVELGNGYVVGRERAITKVARTFHNRLAIGSTVYYYDECDLVHNTTISKVGPVSVHTLRPRQLAVIVWDF